MRENISRTKKSLVNISTSIIAFFVSTILSFINRTVFIYVLGKMYLGINGLFSDVLMMLSLTDLGFSTAMNYKLYKPLAENNIERLRVLMKFYRLAYTVIGVIILIIGICLIPFLPLLIKDYETLSYLNINAGLVFMLYVINSASSYLFSASRSAIISADQKGYIFTITNIITNILTSVMQIASLLVFKNFIIYTLIAIILGIVSNLVVASLSKRMYPEVFIKTSSKLSTKEIRDTFKDLTSLFIYKVDTVVFKATDSIIISKCIGLFAVGVYSNYTMFYKTFSSFLAKIFDSVKASIGNFFAIESLDKQYYIFEICNYVSYLLYGTAAVGIFICSNEVIARWIGLDYVVAQPLSLLIGIELLFDGVKVNLGQIRNITGLYRQMWYRPLIGVVVNIFLSLALVRYIGIFGVVIGTIASQIIANFLIDPKIIYKIYFKNSGGLKDYYLKSSLYIFFLILIGALEYFVCSIVFVGFGWYSIVVHTIICGILTPLLFMLIFCKTKEGKFAISQLYLFVKRKL